MLWIKWNKSSAKTFAKWLAAPETLEIYTHFSDHKSQKSCLDLYDLLIFNLKFVFKQAKQHISN